MTLPEGAVVVFPSSHGTLQTSKVYKKLVVLSRSVLIFQPLLQIKKGAAADGRLFLPFGNSLL